MCRTARRRASATSPPRLSIDAPLLHALLAHHGRLEYGSPVVPQTLEAMVLHSADKLDGDARGALDAYARSDGSGDFSEYSTMHETRLYQGEADG